MVWYYTTVCVIDEVWMKGGHYVVTMKQQQQCVRWAVIDHFCIWNGFFTGVIFASVWSYTECKGNNISYIFGCLFSQRKTTHFELPCSFNLTPSPTTPGHHILIFSLLKLIEENEYILSCSSIKKVTQMAVWEWDGRHH